MCVICNAGLRGGRPAWSTAVGLGPIPYWFAGSNPAPRIYFDLRFNVITVQHREEPVSHLLGIGLTLRLLLERIQGQYL